MSHILGPAILFCPADRPDRILKAAALGDALIIDLEDGVDASRRVKAREALMGLASQLDPRTTLVRVNAHGTADGKLDLAALASSGLHTCILSKADDAAHLRALRPLRVIALCESARGILEAPAMASAENCVGLMFGSEDLATQLGGGRSRDHERLSLAMQKARFDVLFAAKSRSIPAIDTVFPNLGDPDGLSLEAAEAAQAGFEAKACVHPAQIAIVREAFLPSAEEVAWAVRIVEASQELGSGAFRLDSAMIDAPIVRRAQRVVERARHPSKGKDGQNLGST